MKFEKTACRFCGTNEGPLFVRQPMRDDKDYICKKCRSEGKEIEAV